MGRKRAATSNDAPKKKTSSKKAQPDASEPANSILHLMAASQTKEGAQQTVALGTKVCWSWAHWRPVDVEEHGSDVVDRVRYNELKAAKPRLECVHCGKHMAWDPSTKRKRHLCIDCVSFAASQESKDAKVVADREDILRRLGKAAKVRTLSLLLEPS